MLPLITHSDLTAPLAYRKGQAISARQYLAHVQACAERLPAARYVLIACQDRYAFAVGLGAALVRGQSALLPSTHTEELIAQLAEQYESLYCLTDEADCAFALPQWVMQEAQLALQPLHELQASLAVPDIAGEHIAAYVFTSGSTGLPLAHYKTWAKLVVNVKSEGKRLGVTPGSGFSIVGTVPPQHMYGFESTVLIAMQNGAAFEASKPFYPADIEQALARTPRPRALVTTPFHLRAFLTEVPVPPALDLLVCATAPLAPSLAIEAEQKTQAPLLEIYGCTETGQLATRRSAQTAVWHAFDGIKLTEQSGNPFASGQQIEGVIQINDVLELHSEEKFVLHGRTADMVNVAGKSTTLAYLNHQLLSIPGVKDGAFFVPHDEAEGLGSTTRLAAVVVAPALSATELQRELRRKIAPAFLPRPLKFMDDLPRNATGKLPREALLALIGAPQKPA
jgi:acyl-coenzyme A synthetase/AMP-(fatty) acid ligase